jgi:hypothetical protein
MKKIRPSNGPRKRGGRKPAKPSKPAATSPKKWTVLVWMAGDNNLEDFGRTDIGEMKKVGSTADVDVVVQFDSMSDDRARRYHLRKGTSLASDLVKDLGPTNTGDPAVATDFFSWGVESHPADRYLMVLWNHGSGIDETDVYRQARASGLRIVRKGKGTRGSGVVPRSRARSIASRRFRRSLFSSTVDAALRRRGIAYDDTAKDFLDNAELHKVIEAVSRKAGRPIDVVGFDACLMSMLELAYEHGGLARFTVGSEEVEPGDGWPYDRVVGALAADPDMTARQLGETVVQQYLKSYANDDVTMSCLDLSAAGALGSSVDRLAADLKDAIADPAEYAAFTKALNATQHFEMPDFLDLYDLCAHLKTRSTSAAVKASADAIQQSLSAFVSAEGHKGSSVSGAHGVAIYFPRGRVTVVYERLKFAKDTRWDELISSYTGVPLDQVGRRG